MTSYGKQHIRCVSLRCASSAMHFIVSSFFIPQARNRPPCIAIGCTALLPRNRLQLRRRLFLERKERGPWYLHVASRRKRPASYLLDQRQDKPHANTSNAKTMPSATALSASLSNSILSIVPTFRNGGGVAGGGRITSTCVVPAAAALGGTASSTAGASATTSGGGGSAGAVQHAQTTGCYTDSSGRSRIRLLLRLDFGSAEEIDVVVDSGCLVPAPSSSKAAALTGEDAPSAAAAEGGDENDRPKPRKKKSKRKGTASLKFECAPVLDENQSNPISVESIAVQSTHIDTSDPEDCAILFVVEIAVRSTDEEALEDYDDDYTEDGEVKSEDDDGLVAAAENGHTVGGVEGNGNGTSAGKDGGLLQIRAILSERAPSRRSAAAVKPSKVPIGLLALDLGSGFGGGGAGAATGLASASMSADATASISTVHYSTLHTRTRPVNLTLNLVEPLVVTVREVGGARAASGATLVSVTVSHSNQHDEDVTVTNLAIHPGHSRPWDPQVAAAEFHNQQGRGQSRSGNSVTSMASAASRSSMADDATVSPSGSHLHNTSILAGNNAVLDMSTSARWGYAPGTAPSLPLVLKPRESVATVLQIDAGENLRTRGYISPVAVTAVVGAKNDDTSGRPTGEAGDGAAAIAAAASGKIIDPIKTLAIPAEVPVMVSTDARWTTARLAVDPADAFRVDLSLVGSSSTTCKVGAPVVVSLRVMNLSSETKDLMLLMAKDEESSRDKDGGGLGFGGFNRQYRKKRYGSSSASVQSITTSASTPLVGGRPYAQPHSTSHGVNTAVVSEVNGYTFGVWGLSGDDDGTARHNRDHELLAVDAALLLGEVKAQHAIEAELRFVPLREGTLDVPNLKLYDKLGGRWFNCIHLLKLVAATNN